MTQIDEKTALLDDKNRKMDFSEGITAQVPRDSVFAMPSS